MMNVQEFTAAQVLQFSAGQPLLQSGENMAMGQVLQAEHRL